MKKITLIADFGSSYRTGGGATFSKGLLQVLKQLPVELTVMYAWCPEIDKKSPWQEDNMHMIPLSRNVFGKVRGEIIFALGVRSRLKKLPKQDLFILDTPGITARLLPGDIPVIAMAHGSEYTRWADFSIIHPRSSIRRLFWKNLFINPIQKKLLLLRGGLPLFNSLHTLHKIAEDFRVSEAPLLKFVTYLPVDLKAYSRNIQAREKVRRQYAIGDDEVVVAVVSNFANYKRPECLPPIVLGVFKEISPLKVRFFFVGKENPSSAPLETFVRSPDSQGRCIRLFEVPPEKVHTIYSAADIALSTSVSETFGYFVAEGMSASLPFVAYGNSGGVSELIKDGETGFLVNDENEFILRLVDLIRDKDLRKKLGENGFSRIRDVFSRDAFRNKFVKILNSHLKFNLPLQ